MLLRYVTVSTLMICICFISLSMALIKGTVNRRLLRDSHGTVEVEPEPEAVSEPTPESESESNTDNAGRANSVTVLPESTSYDFTREGMECTWNAKVVDKKIRQQTIRNINSVTEEACKTLCENQPNCKAISIRNTAITVCKLKKVNQLTSPDDYVTDEYYIYYDFTCASNNQETVGEDLSVPSEAESISEECYWNKTQDYILAWHNNYVLHTENGKHCDCKRHCESNIYGFQCLSYEFVPGAEYDCVLSNTTKHDSTLLYSRTKPMQYEPGASYHEKICTQGATEYSFFDLANGGTQNCRNGWAPISSASCIAISEEITTYETAKEVCMELDSKMVSIHSSEEEEKLMQAMTSLEIYQSWIGLVNPVNQTISWNDGSELDYHSAYREYYNDGEGVEQCVRLLNNWMGLTGWWDINCVNSYNVVCMVPPGQ